MIYQIKTSIWSYIRQSDIQPNTGYTKAGYPSFPDIPSVVHALMCMIN